MLYAVIMAGGSGTRFWPASRKLQPKQLLSLSGSRTMIQATSDRLAELVPVENQLVITNQILVAPIAQQLPNHPPANLVGEPAKRDTAPCIGLAAALVHHQDPDAVMAVMPSDHVIGTDQQFCQAIEAAHQLVLQDPTRIVTFGIKPTYPAESFGYIQRGAPLPAGNDSGQTGPGQTDSVNAYAVAQFKEKPDQTTAQHYLESGDFYWNSGIFLWRASTILEALKTNQPQMYAHIETIANAIGRPDYQDVLEREFSAIEGTSIDYAVMESYPNVAVIEAPFEWDDVGSWQSLGRLHESDSNGNTVVGKHIGIDTTGSIIFGDPQHTIVTIDIDDLIVVQTKDATLVAPKSSEERVREAVKRIQESGSTDCL
ncbi:sugar phosphate nucleotidyltransferase [Stieleria sp. TO1_6]|uniref:mannose-1-phosphate guanylyltransferase n=1 Tax=Stieleria tagensis TaxID=2956795 RepID=UPI00209B62F8|nr:mannose-1-phosphate guanylyltransferase [Stieleria tagensis]MCO8122780.1 sugar phosphate nucleotidyltransferase [Stieleria tagensis]